VNVTRAKTVEGTATLVPDSADESCPEVCIAEADVEIIVDGTCRYAVFTFTNGTDCPVAAGIVAIDSKTGECCCMTCMYQQHWAADVLPDMHHADLNLANEDRKEAGQQLR
jgi:hypothetical protein